MKAFRLIAKVEKEDLTISMETEGYNDDASDILELIGLLENSKQLLLNKLKLQTRIVKNG